MITIDQPRDFWVLPWSWDPNVNDARIRSTVSRAKTAAAAAAAPVTNENHEVSEMAMAMGNPQVCPEARTPPKQH